MTRITLATIAAATLLASASGAAGQSSLAASNWVARGNQALTEQKYDAALEFFQKAEVDLPDAAEIAYNRGIAHYRKGDFDKAREAFGNALRTRDPKLEARAKFNLGNCAYSTALQKLTDLQGAIDEIRKSINYWHDSLELNSGDDEARQNIETAQLLIKDLLDKEKKRQEEEQKKQQEQQQDQKDEKDQQDQKQEQQQQQDQQKKDQQQQDQKDQQQEQQQQQQDQQKQNQDKKDKDKQKKDEQQKGDQKKKDQLSREDAERQLQAIRDKERARREDRRKQEAMFGGRPPVDRDW